MTTKVTSSVLNNTAVTPGTYGSSANIPVITVDQQGRLSSAANVPYALASTGVIAGNYGSGTTTPVLTIDQYGRVTGATTTLITGGSAGIGATSYVRSSFTATAGQTTFTVTYTVGYVQVYVNGVLLSASDYTSSSGTSIIMGSALRAGDLVDIFAYTVTLVNNVSPSYTGGQGGTAGQVLYQSAANTTSNTDVGTSGYLLTSAGTGKPTWSAQTALSLSSTQITNALGFTPYNSTNPSGYITSAGAPVTSVNGQTGAVVTTDLYAIGSIIMATSTSSSVVSYGSTISGAYLMSPSNGAGNSSTGSYGVYTTGIQATGNYLNSTSGNINTAICYLSRVGTGTWRCLMFVTNARYVNCCSVNTTVMGGPAFFVRVS